MKIVDTDAFLEMPQSSQLLYFHLSMRADDDGFVASPKKIMKIIGSQDDDIRVLIGKRFIIPFESGVCVIKHWRIHNLIREDRYKETTYLKEKSMLILKENGSYTEKDKQISQWQPNGNQMAHSIGKDRLGKVRLGERKDSSISYLSDIPIEDITEFLKRFVITEKQIQGKAEDLKLYCETKGKTYKNYKSFLLNALKKDFPEKDDSIGGGKYQGL